MTIIADTKHNQVKTGPAIGSTMQVGVQYLPILLHRQFNIRMDMHRMYIFNRDDDMVE